MKYIILQIVLVKRLSMCGLLNTDKDKNTFVVGRMTKYMLINACICLVVTQKKYFQNKIYTKKGDCS